MEYKQPKIYITCGKARNGKDKCIEYISNYCLSNNLKHINLSYGSYIKEYAKKISTWDGAEETKPRTLLQQLGTDIIRKNIDDEFFIKRMIDDIKVYSYFFDVITISDGRFPKEIDRIRENFPHVMAIQVIRPNFDNGLSETEKKHPSETGLDNYNNYEYTIINDGTLEALKDKIEKIMEV